MWKSMRTVRHKPRPVSFAVGVIFILMIPTWMVLSPKSSHFKFKLEQSNKNLKVIRELCGSQNKAVSVLDILGVVSRWKDSEKMCRHLEEVFHDIYDVTISTSHISIPDPFKTKLSNWLGQRQELMHQISHQKSISIFNKFTHEHILSNPIRSLRPGVSISDADLEQYFQTILWQSSRDCDFCNYENMTASHLFGRVESAYAVTAANVFPFDGFHGLVILKHHQPLQFTEEEFLGMMEVSHQWFKKANEENSHCLFPLLTWDLLPKASASQVHPHAQIMLNKKRHYGEMKKYENAAKKYSSEFERSYLDDLVQIHAALNLSICLADATALFSLTPKKDNEVMVLASYPSHDFYRLLFHILRTYMDDMKLYAWSMAIFYPALDDLGDWSKDDIPAVARVISRGPVTNPRSDISAFDLFAASNVNIDPFLVARKVKKFFRSKGVLSTC